MNDVGKYKITLLQDSKCEKCKFIFKKNSTHYTNVTSETEPTIWYHFSHTNPETLAICTTNQFGIDGKLLRKNSMVIDDNTSAGFSVGTAYNDA